MALDDVRVVCSEEGVGSCVCKPGYEHSTDGDECVPNLLTRLKARRDTTLTATIIEAAGFGDLLASTEGMTLFAPATSAIFGGDLPLDLSDITAADKAMLDAFVLHHMVGAALLTDNFRNGQRLNTLYVDSDGIPETVLVRRRGSTWYIDDARIQTPDVTAS